MSNVASGRVIIEPTGSVARRDINKLRADEVAGSTVVGMIQLWLSESIVYEEGQDRVPQADPLRDRNRILYG
jgi:hypothetical protein